MLTPAETASPSTTAFLRHPLAIVLLAAALTHGAYQVGRAFFHPKQGLDFTPEYIAAHMLVDERDVRFYDYDVIRAEGRKLGLHGPDGPDDPVIEYAYPPWLPLLYAPLSRLDWASARRIWFAMSLVAVAGACALLGALVARRGEERAMAFVAVGAACLFFPVPYGLMAGQANDLPLLGIAASLFLLRRDRPFLAGLVLAPAGMWKIFTGFPAIFLLARREWRALGGLTAGCTAILLISLPFVGTGAWMDWVRYAYANKLAVGAALRNHSIAASVALLFTPNPVSPPLLDAPALVRPVTLALEGLAIALTTLAIFRPARREDPRYAVQLGATLVLGVLLTPKAWEHYGVFLLPAFLACLPALDARSGRLRAVSLAVLGASFAVWAFLFQVKADYAALATPARVIFIPAKMYAALALLGLCALAGSERRDELTSPLEPAPP